MSTRHWIAALAVAALLWPASARAESTASTTNNKAMAQRVASQIHKSGQLTNYRVGVKYKQGVAWLVGSVTDENQAAAAVQLAKQVNGVTRVVNQLEITPSEPVAEPTLEPKRLRPATETAASEASEGLLLSLDDNGEEEGDSAEQPVVYRRQRQQVMEPRPLREPAPRRMAARPQPARRGMPVPFARTGQAPVQQVAHRNVRPANYGAAAAQGYRPAGGMGGASGVSYDSPSMPGYAWPSYASHPNYAAVTYPRQYSPTAWPYIGPFYPYPQVPLGWRKVALEWDDGWWHLDFSHHQQH